jgi:hypothetical protein
MKHGVGAGCANVRLKERGGMGDNRYRVVTEFERESGNRAEHRKKVVRIEMLGSENTVHRVEGKLAAVIEEIGKMGLPEARLPGEKRDAQ